MQLNNKTIWLDALTKIELSISKSNYKTWFKETFLQEINSVGVALIAVPNQFTKNWMNEKFNQLITKNLIEVEPSIKKVEYVVKKFSDSGLKNVNYKKSKSVSRNQEHTPRENLSFKTEQTNLSTNLNKKYTFDNFVIGSFNEVAYAAAQAVVKRLDEVVYNPFVVYGNTGYGKTHLIQAVGNYIRKNYPEKKVFYTTSEKFQIDVIEFIGMKSGKNLSFKKKYRKYDVLILDDIQFFTKKERTQEEIFHVFNYLYDNNKQIILSSDRHPNQIPDLEDRLRSRFNAGMTVDIQKPDFESRVEILKKKSRNNGYNINEKTLEYIASTITGNIRELEGILNNIFIQTELKGAQIPLEDIKKIIKSTFKKKQPLNDVKLVSLVANYYNINDDQLYKKSRKKEFVKPRQVAMYLLREDFGYSYPTIGEKIGGRDHTTVMHSYSKIEKELKDSVNLQNTIENLRNMY